MWSRLKATEPAALAEFVRLVVAGLVGLGWIVLDDTVISAIATLVGAVWSAMLTRFVRANVTPVGRETWAD